MEDEQIIQLFFERNEKAITETVKKHGNICRKTADRILDNEQDAEECVNDALAQLWNKIPPHKPHNLAAFLVTITRNIALDRYKYNTRNKRGNGQLQFVFDEISDCICNSEDVEKVIDERLLVQSLEAFLDTLTNDTRAIFVQRYVMLLSIKEIADKCDISESNVKIKLMRTRKKLRKHLKKEGWL